jgi:hypothetical protein
MPSMLSANTETEFKAVEEHGDGYRTKTGFIALGFFLPPLKSGLSNFLLPLANTLLF